jgi:hypothetical protein
MSFMLAYLTLEEQEDYFVDEPVFAEARQLAARRTRRVARPRGSRPVQTQAQPLGVAR